MHFLNLQIKKYVVSNGMNFIVKKHLFVLQIIMLIHILKLTQMKGKQNPDEFP